MSTRKIIVSNKAPKPVGPYNQAIQLDNMLYVSGCLGLGADMKLVGGGAVSEARQALTNLGHILNEAGSSYDKVIKTTLFLDDINDFGQINEMYKQGKIFNRFRCTEVFATNSPARSTIQVGKLPMSAKFEIEAIAVVGDVKTIGPGGMADETSKCICMRK